MYQRWPGDAVHQAIEFRGQTQSNRGTANAHGKCVDRIPMLIKPVEVAYDLIKTVPIAQAGEVTDDVAHELESLLDLIDPLQSRWDLPGASSPPPTQHHTPSLL